MTPAKLGKVEHWVIRAALAVALAAIAGLALYVLIHGEPVNHPFE